MAVKRLTRKLTEVATEVESQLKSHYNITQKQLDAWKARAHSLQYSFPVSNMEKIDVLYIDYEVQRDVLHKHIINIMKKWDPRICSPVSACRVTGISTVNTYDGQHRTIAAAILGFTEIPCAVVDTSDSNFPSYAFEMLNDTGVKKLNPGDLHRNALVRYKNGSRDIKNVRAFNMQTQFDNNQIDLQDKNSRASATLCGDNEYFFSHFKYAQKAIELDESGKVLGRILQSIKEVFPLQEEIDQGVFIGLYELQRLAGTTLSSALPDDWMVTVLTDAKKFFKSSHIVHMKCKTQWEHRFPGASWSAPSAMANFLRELHMKGSNTINLPTHGAGASLEIASNPAAGLFPAGVQ